MILLQGKSEVVEELSKRSVKYITKMFVFHGCAYDLLGDLTSSRAKQAIKLPGKGKPVWCCLLSIVLEGQCTFKVFLEQITCDVYMLSYTF